MEIWHKRIKQLRENTDVTLKDMANDIGVSEATVQRYENGKIQELPYKAIIAYAKKFSVHPSYIMGWSDKVDRIIVNTPEQELTVEVHPQKPKPFHLSKEEENIIIAYRKQQDAVKDFVCNALGVQREKSDTETA